MLWLGRRVRICRLVRMRDPQTVMAFKALLVPLTNQRPLPPGVWAGRAAASPFMAAGSNGSSTLVSSTNTVVFTPDRKSNDTALGSFEAGADRGYLRPPGAGSAPDAGS